MTWTYRKLRVGIILELISQLKFRATVALSIAQRPSESDLHLRTSVLSIHLGIFPLTDTASMANINWRTINIDALDPESSYNFDLSTLTPTVQPTSTADVNTLGGQIRQLLRGGNAEGALQGALENAPYGADAEGKVRRHTQR